MSLHGFRNIKPRTREERAALKDKAALEKARLMQRPGNKLYRENAPLTPLGLIVPEPTAAGYLSDADRFHTDVSGEEFLRRRAATEARQQFYSKKRIERVEREERRWADLKLKNQREEEYWAAQRELGSKKNASSVPYDAITLCYSKDLGGEELRFQDDEVKYRAAVRSKNLQECGDTRTGYNIINGIENEPILPPTKPQPSVALAKHMDAINAAAAAQRAKTYSGILRR